MGRSDIGLQATPYGTANVKDFGAYGDGAHDDTIALQGAINSGKKVVIPSGTYAINSIGLSIMDGSNVQMENEATLVLSAPVTIGSKTATSTHLSARVRVKPATGYSGVLVEMYNLTGSLGLVPQVSVELTANAETNDFVHIHSTNGLGFVDTVLAISTNSFTCNNGITLMNGDKDIASVAADFINGNLFVKPDLSCNVVCLGIQPTGPAAGSVSGTINRNMFLRPDWNSYNTAAVKSLSAGNAAYNEFVDATFETGGGGASVDVDLVTNLVPGGQFFRHIAARNYATQKLNVRDMWIEGEQDNGDYHGYYGVKAAAVQASNRQIVTQGAAISSTSTSFVSTGVGTPAIGPNFLDEFEIALSAEVLNNTAGDGARVAIYRNTTGVPVSGTAVGTDTQVWASGVLLSSAASQIVPTSAIIIDAGVANGSNYYYYIAMLAVTGGTASVQNVSFVVREA